MDITKEDAQESLSLIDRTVKQTVESAVAAYASPILILWGLICFIAYLGTYFFMKWSWHIWIILDSAGAIGTFIICSLRYKKSTPTRIEGSNKIWLRIFLFWIFLLAYILILLNTAQPLSSLQVNALIVMFVMFAYVVFGLWISSNILIWLGLAVTIFTIIGFYLIPHNYYCLWMAFTVAPVIIGTGLATKYFWK